MNYIECPEAYNKKEKSLFIAGGITGCENWQNELVNFLKNEEITLLNPRREEFDQTIKEEEQIEWEFEHLKKAEAVSFWFPEETLCPITLFELSKQTALNKTIFIGIHPNYKRKNDVIIQTKLARPEVKIVYSLKDLAKQIKDWTNS